MRGTLVSVHFPIVSIGAVTPPLAIVKLVIPRDSKEESEESHSVRLVTGGFLEAES